MVIAYAGIIKGKKGPIKKPAIIPSIVLLKASSVFLLNFLFEKSSAPAHPPINVPIASRNQILFQSRRHVLIEKFYKYCSFLISNELR